MPTTIPSLIQECRDRMQAATDRSGVTMVTRRPRWPMMMVFLGKHPDEYVQEVQRTLELSWPSRAASVRMLHYETPASFENAMALDRGKMAIELEDEVCALCDSEKGFLESTDAIMAYFLDVNDPAAPDYIRQLNEKFEPPVGGQMKRFIFLMCHALKTAELIVTRETIDLLRKYSEDPANERVWNNTYIVTIGTQLRDGSPMQKPEQQAEGYALAMELLVIFNSVRLDNSGATPLILTPVTMDGCFITGALRRLQKPDVEIVRSVLHTYTEHCIQSNKTAASAKIPPVESLINMCREMMGSLFNARIAPYLPRNEDIRALPNGGAFPGNTGETGPDVTFGCWEAFKKKHYSDAVRRACGSMEQLQDEFERQLSHHCNSLIIQERFDALYTRLGEPDALVPEFPGANTLADIGVYEARRTVVEYALPLLRAAVLRLRDAAKDYGAMLNRIHGTTAPWDDDIGRFYMQETNRYIIGRSGELETEMQHPCDEQTFFERLHRFFGEMLDSEQLLRYSFEDELSARIGVKEASNQISGELSVAESDMQQRMRMRIGDYEECLGDYAIINPDAEYAKHDSHIIGSRFELGRTDCVDRVAFYKYHPDRIL